MDQIDLANRICAAFQNSEIECGLRGSLLAGTADQYSDIDLYLKTEEIDLDFVNQTIITIQALVGEAIEIRFDNDQPEIIFLTFHSYSLPVFYRIDVELHGKASPQLRETLKKKYPWHTEWHHIATRAYHFKQAARNQKNQKSTR